MTHSPKTPFPRKWIFRSLALVTLLAVAAVDFSMGYKTARRRHRWYAVTCDGAMIGSAAQQYMLTHNTTTVTFAYDPLTGQISGDITPWIKNIGKNLLIPDTTINADDKRAFSIGFRDVEGGDFYWFTDEGKLVGPQDIPDGYRGITLPIVGGVFKGVDYVIKEVKSFRSRYL